MTEHRKAKTTKRNTNTKEIQNEHINKNGTLYRKLEKTERQKKERQT